MKKFYVGILSIAAAILICASAVTARAADCSSQEMNEAHGQVLDKDENVLKDVSLSKNIETVQGDAVTTDIILFDDGSYAYVTEEIEEPAASADAEWLERFNTLTPEQQAKINFRPDRESGELLPQETTER